MNLKYIAKSITPPLFWSTAMKLLSPDAVDRTQAKDLVSRTAKIVSDTTVLKDQFSIAFTKVDIDAATFFVPKYAEHRPACQCILQGEFYEPDTHALVFALMRERPGSIIHAGTFFGDMLPSFAEACQATVYAFEPVLENYVLAKLCVEHNNLNNVVLQNAGLGSAISVAQIDTGAQGGAHRGGASEISSSGQITSLVPIDSLAATNVSLIQLDVEGYELEALKGAIETINTNSPIVMIEDNNDNCSSFLESLHYRYITSIPGLKIYVSINDSIDIERLISVTHDCA
jgi:FkbM family methyltransferase